MPKARTLPFAAMLSAGAAAVGEPVNGRFDPSAKVLVRSDQCWGPPRPVVDRRTTGQDHARSSRLGPILVTA